jgi:hypothetical protein
MYIILSIFLFWIICGFISYNLQQYLYIKEFGHKSDLVFIHFVFGPLALFCTYLVDYLKLFE